jgi:hypothetical protein
LARPYLEKTLHKKGLVKWVQMQTLNSSPNTTKKKKKKVQGSGGPGSQEFAGQY